MIILSRGRSARAIAQAGESARLFAALGDRTRLQLVSRLCEHGPLSITQLTHGARVTRQAVTKHLRVLEDAGLARCSKQGRHQVWQLEIEPIENARHSLERLARRWEEALSRLKELVASH